MKKKIVILFLCLLTIFIPGCSKTKDYSQEELDQLKSLPYVSWTAEDIDSSIYGVTTYIPEKVYPGYNLFLNLKDKAYLLDMEGTIVHTWYMPYHTGQWEYGYLKPDGNLVAYAIDLAVTEVDWHSDPVWYTKMRVHHDVEMLPDGTYLVPDTMTQQYKSRTVLFNSIRHLSKKGVLLDEWSTWDHLEEIQKFHDLISLDEEPQNVEEVKDQEFDYYHLNSIKLLPPNKLGEKDSRFQEGNWLICLRNISLVLILDKDTKQIVWNWGPGELDWPHMPVMLTNGEILIFDNGANFRKSSRVIQLNPEKKMITWEYSTDPPGRFFSHYWGGIQRFPNGNTLITNSASGHVFELTENKKIVWEFYNFDIFKTTRKRIYRFMRYPKEMVDILLENLPDNKQPIGKLKNPGFETLDAAQDKIPGSWKYSAWIFETAELTWDTKVARTGTRSAKINFTSNNVGYWGQLLPVESNSTYRLTGWAKIKDIPSKDPLGHTSGVSIGAQQENKYPVLSKVINGTSDWTQLSCTFNTGEDSEIEIQLKIGSFGSEITGTAWFDDIELEKIE